MTNTYDLLTFNTPISRLSNLLSHCCTSNPRKLDMPVPMNQVCPRFSSKNFPHLKTNTLQGLKGMKTRERYTKA